MLRKAAVVLLVAVCIVVVVGFQTTRERGGVGDPRVFVPSPRFYEKLSGSFQVPVADSYWLYSIQYYGEHVNSDRRLDSLHGMLNLVTELSPHFKQAYFFGAFALLDARRPDLGYALLERGFRENHTDWHFPFYLGFFVYTFADNANKDAIAAQWYEKAAQLPGHLPSVPRLAAALYQKGHEKEKSMTMWAQVYGQGDRYAREKAVVGLDALLPKNKTERMKAVASLKGLMSPQAFDRLVGELFRGYY